MNRNTWRKFEDEQTWRRDIENCGTSKTDIVIFDESEPREICRDIKNDAEAMNITSLSTIDDEDLVIVSDSKDNVERMSRRTLNRVVKCTFNLFSCI